MTLTISTECPTRLAGHGVRRSDFLVSDPPHSPQAVVETFLGDDDDAWRDDDADEEYNSVFMSVHEIFQTRL